RARLAVRAGALVGGDRIRPGARHRPRKAERLAAAPRRHPRQRALIVARAGPIVRLGALQVAAGPSRTAAVGPQPLFVDALRGLGSGGGARAARSLRRGGFRLALLRGAAPGCLWRSAFFG